MILDHNIINELIELYKFIWIVKNFTYPMF